MRAFFDTSVLVAALVESHPAHNRAFPWLRRALAGEMGFVVAGHTLLELYAVLTKLPVSPKISPGIAYRLVSENIETTANVVSLSAEEYGQVVKSMAQLNLGGGIVYDALLAKCAEKTDAERLLTLNPKDFIRVWPEGAGLIHAP